MYFIDIYATVIDICPQDYAETSQVFVLIFLLSFQTRTRNRTRTWFENSNHREKSATIDFYDTNR